jgi:hypothetical protein
LDCTQEKGRQAPRGVWATFLRDASALSAPSRTQCYFGSCPAWPKASLGPCLAVRTPKRHTALEQPSCRHGSALCTWPRPNAILGPPMPSPRLVLGHAWQRPRQSATWRLDFSVEKAGQAPHRAWAMRPKDGTQAPRVRTAFFS